MKYLFLFLFTTSAFSLCNNPEAEKIVRFTQYWQGKMTYVWDGQLLRRENGKISPECTKCLNSAIDAHARGDTRTSTAYFRDPHAPHPEVSCARCGTDCTGLVYAVLKDAGHLMNPRIDTPDYLNANKEDLLELGLIKLPADPKQTRPGDMLLFRTPENGRHIGFLTEKTSQTSGYFEHSTTAELKTPMRSFLNDIMIFENYKLVAVFRTIDTDKFWNQLNDKGASCLKFTETSLDPYEVYKGPLKTYFSKNLYQKKESDVIGREEFLKKYEKI